MTKSLRAYVMTKQVLTRLTRKHGQRITCYTCGEPVSEGDKVVASCQQGRRKHKVRHEACYESTFITRREGWGKICYHISKKTKKQSCFCRLDQD